MLEQKRACLLLLEVKGLLGEASGDWLPVPQAPSNLRQAALVMANGPRNNDWARSDGDTGVWERVCEHLEQIHSPSMPLSEWMEWPASAGRPRKTFLDCERGRRLALTGKTTEVCQEVKAGTDSHMCERVSRVLMDCGQPPLLM